jgi:protein-L-isoaspartate O-methyltransferase
MTEITRIQQNTNTEYNRYEEVFTSVKSQKLHPKTILSFGCSTGEEVQTLAEIWFPMSTVIGVDINEKCLEEAQEKVKHLENAIILYSNKDNIEQHAPYDIIFAMSVLCSWPQSKDLRDISSVFPFSDFERHVDFLAKQLSTGGIMVIWNSSFKFTDTVTAEGFNIINDNKVARSGFVKKFDKNNIESSNQEYPYFIFQKV